MSRVKEELCLKKKITLYLSGTKTGKNTRKKQNKKKLLTRIPRIKITELMDLINAGGIFVCESIKKNTIRNDKTWIGN